MDMAIIIDINKAKDITKDRLRAERKPLLEAQDVEFIKAQEQGADTSAIVAEKQRLRDITNTVDSMTTVEELKGASVK
jgi:predicted nucleotidyltransferase